MSSQHPIDTLVRSKLEQRSFPAEAGEMDDMRSMIDLHNASSAANGGAAHWAWSLLLLPAVVLLWWATNGSASRNDGPTPNGTMAEMRPSYEADASPHNAHMSSAQSTDPNNTDLFTVRSSGNNGSVAVQHVKHTRAAWKQASAQCPIAPGRDAVEAGSTSDATTEGTPVASLEARAMSTWFDLAALNVLAPQAPLFALHPTAAARERALGNLHFLGAAVSTNAASAQASGTGNWFGIEYRIKAKHFSAATGMHYGSYTFSTDPTVSTCEVRLDYMQVPVLAGYERSLGRWGVLAQAGITCDLFFQSSGRYGALAEHTPRTIDDGSFRTVNMQVLVRPQLLYRVNEQLGLVTGPVWSQHLATLATTGPLAGARATSTGVAFGLTWRLARSTY